MRVLVTGGAGYIGDAVVEHLLREHNRVLVVDNLTYADEYTRPDVTFKRVDITSPDFLSYLKGERFDAIVHLAAIVGDAACNVDQNRTIDVNLKTTRALVDFVKENAPDTKFIFASTCSVYGAAGELLDENSPTNPHSLYASSKLEAEDFVRELRNHVIFRLGTIFGLSSPHGRIRADLVVNVMTFMALDCRPLMVFGGDQWRPLVHVGDVGEIIAKCLDTDINGTFILSNKNYRIVDVAEKIVKVLGRGKVETRDVPFEDLRNYKVDVQKLFNEGFYPHRTLEDGVLELAQFFESGRVKDPWHSKYHNYRFLQEIKERG